MEQMNFHYYGMIEGVDIMPADKECVYCNKETTDRYYTDNDKPICEECWDEGNEVIHCER